MDDKDRRSVLTLLVAGTFFMENLDATVITPALPAMAKSFAVAPVDLNIGISAYMITLGIFIPLTGWFAERFGPRRIFALAIALFTIASLFCGLSSSLYVFVLARIVQGIGGALMVPVGRLVVLREMPKDRLVHVIAMLTWPALIAPVLGPPLGGLIAGHGDWRWIFYLNLPLGLIAFFLTLRLLPARKHGEREETKQIRFDWIGFLLIGAASFFIMVMCELLSQPDLGEWHEVVIFFILGSLLSFLSVFHLRRAERPIFDIDSMKIITFMITLRGGSLFRMGVNAVPFLVPLMFQIAFGFDAFSSGLMLMAVFAGNLVMKTMTTAVLKLFGFRPVLVINGLLNAAAIALCATFTTSMPIALICFILFVGGMTRSMQFTALNTIAFADIEEKEMASANTLFSTIFQLSGGLGIALAALSWRMGEGIIASSDAAMPFRIAFLVVAFVSLLSVWDTFILDPHAGDHVSGRRKADKAHQV